MPLALANGIEWGTNERRYERLYNWTQYPHVFVPHVLYCIGFVIGRVTCPEWARHKGLKKWRGAA